MSFLDLTNVKETSFEPVPQGTYLVIADDVELRDTKAGDGQYLNVKFKILDGEQDGRMVYHRFNIKNKNEKATNIGLSQLRSFMRLSGRSDMALQSPLDLVGMRCLAVVKHKTDDYGTKAEISYFKEVKKVAQDMGDLPF